MAVRLIWLLGICRLLVTFACFSLEKLELLSLLLPEF
ncbi:MAG: hypothetical protein N838_29970 [Thiohalocapsa sp. PB-PSB1]|nr:MAG: hypothetical protein N838_29970 [Thiohalocapsa sp. PB-PSB1]